MILSEKGVVVIKGTHEEITTDFCSILISLINKGCAPAITTSLGVVLENDAKKIAKEILDDKNN